MIRIKRGFDVDINASTGAKVFIKAGTLFDDNSNVVYAPGKKSFDKILGASKWVYYNVVTEQFVQQDSEIPLEQLDSFHQQLCPVVYIETTNTGEFVKLIRLIYDENFNLPVPIDGTISDISVYRNIIFVTETDIPVVGKTITVQHDILHVFNVFIYDHGDVILGTLSFDKRTITLLEDVSPALCEVTYGYVS